MLTCRPQAVVHSATMAVRDTRAVSKVAVGASTAAAGAEAGTGADDKEG